MIVFGIGMPKTGTCSLTAALNRLGVPCLHDPSPHQARLILRGERVEPYQAACGHTLYRQWYRLYERYPAAKFVLTSRPKEEWLTSRVAHVYRERVAGGPWQHIDTRRDASDYDAHYRAVRRFFGRRPGFVELPLGSGWAPLCGVLGMPEPDEPYPHENTAIGGLRRLLSAMENAR